MPVTRSKHEILCIGIIGIASVAHDQVTVAAVYEDGVETQNPPVAWASDRSFQDCAGSVVEETVNNLHLRREALRVNGQIRFSAVVVHRENPSYVRPL